MNYNELIQHGPPYVYALDQEVMRKMPHFIRQAELRLVRDLERELFRSFASGTVTADDPTVDLRLKAPMEIRRLKIIVDGVDVVLTLRNIEFLEALYGDSTRREVPQFYGETHVRQVYRMFRAPERDYSWEAIISARPAVLTPSNPTNILTSDFGNLLEAEVFRRAAMFKGDDARAQVYAAEYQSELSLANAEIRRSKRDETEVRPRDTSNRIGN